MKKLVVAYEIVMFSLALISIIIIWSDNQAILMLDQIVLFIFILDVAVRTVRAENKWEYIKQNPFDFIAIIPFDAIFQLARFVRLFRVVRMVLIGKKFTKPIFAILKTNGLDKILGITAGLIIASSIPIHFFETSVETYQDALWWSLVTATTVGYGDISPETGIGRMVAVVLMFVGIGMIGMVTGSIATFFIKGEDESNSTSTISYLKGEMDKLDQLSSSEIENVIVILEKYRNEKLPLEVKKESVR